MHLAVADRGESVIDPVAAERAELEIDSFISRRSRDPRELANEAAREERERDRRKRAQIRAEHRGMWVDFYRRQAEAHALLAGENERRALKLLEDQQGGERVPP